MKNKHLIILVIFILLFSFGIILILKSDTWPLGSVKSMNLAGSIISIFSGIGILMELFQKKIKW